MYTAPATAITTTAPAQAELSNTYVHAPIQVQTDFALNARLVSQTLIAAARHKAGFTVPKPNVSMRYYTNPDGTVCSSHRESLAFDRQGFHS